MTRTYLTKTAQIHQLQRALEQERSYHAQTCDKCKQYLSTSLQFKQRLDSTEAEIAVLREALLDIVQECEKDTA